MTDKENKTIKLVTKIKVTATIELLTGLHIGGTDQGIDMGGIDSLIVRNSLDNQPYIPGSSIKGKLRSLIELKDGTIGKKKMGAVFFTVTDDHTARAFRLFGSASNDEHQRPSRLIVRDAKLANADDMQDLELPYAEAKTEVTIDRITAKAMPRTLERVPAGAKFDMQLIVNILIEDNQNANDIQNELLTTLSEAMHLLEDDYLGGSGSRGYGQIKFDNVNFGNAELTEKYWKNK